MTFKTPDEVMAFHTNECLQIHAECDRCNVPRKTPDGALFSMAQRVSILSGVLQGFVTRAVGAPPTVTH